jgi:hypothetical protein
LGYSTCSSSCCHSSVCHRTPTALAVCRLLGDLAGVMPAGDHSGAVSTDTDDLS